MHPYIAVWHESVLIFQSFLKGRLDCELPEKFSYVSLQSIFIVDEKCWLVEVELNSLNDILTSFNQNNLLREALPK